MGRKTDYFYWVWTRSFTVVITLVVFLWRCINSKNLFSVHCNGRTIVWSDVQLKLFVAYLKVLSALKWGKSWNSTQDGRCHGRCLKRAYVESSLVTLPFELVAYDFIFNASQLNDFRIKTESYVGLLLRIAKVYVRCGLGGSIVSVIPFLSPCFGDMGSTAEPPYTK
jgi:hypothetical protein